MLMNRSLFLSPSPSDDPFLLVSTGMGWYHAIQMLEKK